MPAELGKFRKLCNCVSGNSLERAPEFAVASWNKLEEKQARIKLYNFTFGSLITSKRLKESGKQETEMKRGRERERAHTRGHVLAKWWSIFETGRRYKQRLQQRARITH